MAKRTNRDEAKRRAWTVREVIEELRGRGDPKLRDGMARYGIVNPKAFGMSVPTIRALGKRIGRDHELALRLWEEEWYEARMLATFIAKPDLITPKVMDAWCADFDNWAICDAACFGLFDRTPHAFAAVRRWRGRKGEFAKRAAFAIVAGAAIHDRKAPDSTFLEVLPYIREAAEDSRNFVWKGVSWALRSLGQRNAALHAAATDLAEELAASDHPIRRRIGKDALRDLSRGRFRSLGAIAPASTGTSRPKRPTAGGRVRSRP